MKTINDYAELVKEKHALNETIAPVEADETDASKAYQVGEQLILSGILYDVIAPISQHDVITTTGSGANIAPAGPISAKIQTLTNKLNGEIKTRAKVSAHNFLKFPYYHTNGRTNNGVLFNVDNDGVLSISRTSTSSNVAYFEFRDQSESDNSELVSMLKNDTYKFSYAEEVSGVYISIAYYNGASLISKQEGVDLTITVPENTTNVLMALYVDPGFTSSEPVTIKPLLSLASDMSSEFEPYAMTNRELTEKSIIKDVSGYSWDSAIDGNKDISVKRYGDIVSIYGYFNSTTALAQYANILSGLPHCATGASKSSDIAHNMGITLQNVDSATSKIIVDSATTANLQYAFSFVYLTDK